MRRSGATVGASARDQAACWRSYRWVGSLRQEALPAAEVRRGRRKPRPPRLSSWPICKPRSYRCPRLPPRCSLSARMSDPRRPGCGSSPPRIASQEQAYLAWLAWRGQRCQLSSAWLRERSKARSASSVGSRLLRCCHSTEPELAGEAAWAQLARAPPGLDPLAAGRRCGFDLQARGAISSLRLEEQPAFEAPLPAGEAELRVHAVGLNFRDVLNVLGEYPGDPGPPGSDCAGVIADVGGGAGRLRPGGAVLGLAHAPLGLHGARRRAAAGAKASSPLVRSGVHAA